MDSDSRPGALLKHFLYCGSLNRTYNCAYNGGDLLLKSDSCIIKDVSEIISKILNECEERNTILSTVIKALESPYCIDKKFCLYVLATIIRYVTINEIDPGEKESIKIKSELTTANNDSSDASCSTKPETEAQKRLRKGRELVNKTYETIRKACESNDPNMLIFSYYLRHNHINKNKSGFGNGWRRTVDKYYTNEDWFSMCSKAAMLYPSKWQHKHILQLRHMSEKTVQYSPPLFVTLLYIKDGKSKGYNNAKSAYESLKNNSDNVEDLDKAWNFIEQIHNIRRETDTTKIIQLIEKNKFIKYEHVPSQSRLNAGVMKILIPRMKPIQLLSIIPTLTNIFNNRNDWKVFIDKLQNLSPDDIIEIHPYYPYCIYIEYMKGQSLKKEYVEKQNKKNRNIDQQQQLQNNQEEKKFIEKPRFEEVSKCLIDLFDTVLEDLRPTNQRYLIAIDKHAIKFSERCRPEMTITTDEACLLMALCVIKSQPKENVQVMSFGTNSFENIEFSNGEIISISTLRAKVVNGDIGDDVSDINSLLDHLCREGNERANKYDIIMVLTDDKLKAENLDLTLKNYHNTTKLITCCVRGDHGKKLLMSMKNMLFVSGFHRKVGRVIEGFCRGSF